MTDMTTRRPSACVSARTRAVACTLPVLVALILITASATSVHAADTAVPGSSADASSDTRPELQELLPNSRLVGKGRLTVWGFQVYDARLWGPKNFSGNNLAAQPFALELAYLRAFDKVDVAERSITEMRRAGTISDVQAQAWTDDLLRVLVDVKKGDRIMGVNRPGVGALFVINGKPGGEIRDLEFARRFFGIWLAPQTSEPQLRSALLAGAV
ncbi:MAG: chalcone isomerase family protein [Polaromonas sp.]|nr:chalcone isomerase family protein [Polaromonas sp.]